MGQEMSPGKPTTRRYSGSSDLSGVAGYGRRWLSTVPTAFCAAPAGGVMRSDRAIGAGRGSKARDWLGALCQRLPGRADDGIGPCGEG